MTIQELKSQIEAGKVTAEKGAKISIGTAAEGTYTIVKAKDVDNQMSDEDVTFDGGLKTGTWINSATEMNLKVAIKNLKEETELVPTENAGLVESALKNIFYIYLPLRIELNLYLILKLHHNLYLLEHFAPTLALFFVRAW